MSARPHLCLTSGLGPSASLVSPFPDSSNVQIKGIGVLGERVERTGADGRARVRAHVLTRVRAPELTNIPLHMRRSLQYASAAGEFFLGRAERQRWGLEGVGTPSSPT